MAQFECVINVTTFSDVVEEVPIGRGELSVDFSLLFKIQFFTEQRHRQVDGQHRHTTLSAFRFTLYGFNNLINILIVIIVTFERFFIMG